MKNWRDTPPPASTPGFALTERQEEAELLLRGPQRHTLLVGGARSGKTSLIVHDDRGSRDLCATVAPRDLAISRQRGASVDCASIRCRRFSGFAFPNEPIKRHRTEGYFSLENGSEIWLAGLDDQERVEKILGKEYATIFLNECSQIPYSSVLMALTRLAQVVEGFRRPPITISTRPIRDIGRMFCSAKSAIRYRASRSTIQTIMRGMFLNPADNAANLSEEYLSSLERLPERQRKRFFEGVYIDDLDGALFSYEVIARARVSEIARAHAAAGWS